MLVRDFTYSKGEGLEKRSCKVLAKHIGKGGFYLLCEYVHWAHNGERYNEVTIVTIICIQMNHNKGETVYKEMDITVGPYMNDVPASWLPRVTETAGYANDWLERARKYVAARDSKKGVKVAPGLKLDIHGTIYTVEAPIPSIRGAWRVIRNDGQPFRVSVGKIRKFAIV